MKIGFDHKKYLEEQSKYILERVNNFDKLYLEFGGKLIGDLHAKRVLPGFDENAKIKVLQHIKEKVEVVICVYAGDIERNKIRGDFGITYDMEVLRLIDDLRSYELDVNSVVITRYEGQPATTVFINKLERRGIKVYKHAPTKGYPTDVDTIVSDEGYGKNDYIETEKPLVVITAPGPGSGKMATCLSQLYHDGLMEAIAVNQIDVFSAAQLFAKTETILPAPESAHAIRTAIDEALICKETGEKKTILFGLSGTGYFDMKAYDAYLQNKMVNSHPSEADLQKSFADLPSVPV